MDGKLERGVASVTVMLTETKEWLHTKVKRERSLEVGSYLEDFPGEFNDKTVTFALPLSLSLEPTIDYDPVKITHKLSILIDSASPDSLTEKLLDVRSEIPYAVAGFTRDDCDDLVAEEGNIPNEVLSQMSRQFIGKRLKDMEYIKFSAETLTRIVKDRPMEVSPTGVRPPRGG
ncbi:hypothetical protein BC829DRAFT_383323 [Chytridium lagenaria]|nr:hypothetical protein BC829DRAFT_383323 [Chytridium lagenaria]